jgi:hypothetical protein
MATKLCTVALKICLSVELDTYHPSGDWDFEAAFRFLANNCAPLVWCLRKVRGIGQVCLRLGLSFFVVRIRYFWYAWYHLVSATVSVFMHASCRTAMSCQNGMHVCLDFWECVKFVNCLSEFKSFFWAAVTSVLFLVGVLLRNRSLGDWQAALLDPYSVPTAVELWTEFYAGCWFRTVADFLQLEGSCGLLLK